MTKPRKITKEDVQRIKKAEEKKETKSNDGFVERVEKAVEKNKK